MRQKRVRLRNLGVCRGKCFTESREFQNLYSGSMQKCEISVSITVFQEIVLPMLYLVLDTFSLVDVFFILYSRGCCVSIINITLNSFVIVFSCGRL